MERKKVDGDYLLKKFPGKGGWTYTEIPEISQNPRNPFGWVKVSGSIDGYELKQHKLMPMSHGQLFLPVKAEIRNKIQKEAGDWVKVVLETDESPLEIPDEILDCFKHEPPLLYERFTAFSEGDQKAYLDWIYEAKTEETRVKRIATLMERLQDNLRFYDK